MQVATHSCGHGIPQSALLVVTASSHSNQGHFSQRVCLGGWLVNGRVAKTSGTTWGGNVSVGPVQHSRSVAVPRRSVAMCSAALSQCNALPGAILLGTAHTKRFCPHLVSEFTDLCALQRVCSCKEVRESIYTYHHTTKLRGSLCFRENHSDTVASTVTLTELTLLSPGLVERRGSSPHREPTLSL